ncbi:MAG: hypothetical protein HZB39_05045 [Planctomycetes bacterium]|nr:hypothetical protein [Planctomycetota bacterium]
MPAAGTAVRSSLVAIALAATGVAQLGARHAPGGTPIEIDVGNALFTATNATWPGVLGCAKDAQGRYWVTVRRLVRHDPASPHMLFAIDARGNVVGSWPQPAATAASRWGLRDLAFDGARFLFAGCEADRIFAFDTQNGVWDPSREVPVPAGLSFGTMRALAFDAAGDGGRGSLWIGNLSSEHIEIDLRGNLLRRVANVQPESYAAAFDPVRRSVWWFGQTGSTWGSAAHVVITEMDAASGLATRTRFLGDMTVIAPEYGGHASGAELRIEGGEPVLLLGVQSFGDLLYEVKAGFRFGPSAGSSIGMDGDAAYAGNAAFDITLANSTAHLAALLVGLGEANVALPPPYFAWNAHVLIDLSLPVFDSPFTTVSAGAAHMPFPIPSNPAVAGVDLWVQWVEVPFAGGAPTWPIATSDGARFHISP